MDSIRVKNFRSIVDSNDIQLNSINILLGENSSGKSSLLRLFPMFKESTQHELRGPLLWFDEYYDFGDFSNTVNRNAPDKAIDFNYKWKYIPQKTKDSLPLPDSDDVFKTFKDFDVTIRVAEEDGITILKYLLVKCNYRVSKRTPYIIEIFENNGQLKIKIDSREVPVGNLSWNYNTKNFIPRVQGIRSIYLKVKECQKELSSDENNLLYDTIIGSFGFKEIDIRRFLLKNYPVSLSKIEAAQFDDIISALLLYRVKDTIEYISKYFSSYFRNVFYITPLRYNFTRYMRYKDLAVDSVAPDGRNVMEFIASLTAEELTIYNEFLTKTLNISVSIKGKENKGIYIINSDGEEDNIVDVGYGFSQVLPIATMLWDRAYKLQKECSMNTIVIEQPEVHLHPHMQAKLAHLFLEAINISKIRGNKLCLVVETHSNVLVNQFGKCVYYNQTKQRLDNSNVKASSEDISIYLFEKKQGVTNIISTCFNDMGRINQWPIGFLD